MGLHLRETTAAELVGTIDADDCAQLLARGAVRIFDTRYGDLDVYLACMNMSRLDTMRRSQIAYALPGSGAMFATNMLQVIRS